MATKQIEFVYREVAEKDTRVYKDDWNRRMDVEY